MPRILSCIRSPSYSVTHHDVIIITSRRFTIHGNTRRHHQIAGRDSGATRFAPGASLTSPTMSGKSRTSNGAAHLRSTGMIRTPRKKKCAASAS
jgi:hypothetical protein